MRFTQLDVSDPVARIQHHMYSNENQHRQRHLVISLGLPIPDFSAVVLEPYTNSGQGS